MEGHSAQRTHDHEEIRRWIDSHGGRPAVVRGTEGKGSALLRVDFGEPDTDLEEVPWDEFFRIFEESSLDFLYQEETADGSESRFFKFVERE